MAKLTINTGTIGNDNTGDTLRSGGNKINNNFDEVYSALGNGTELLSGDIDFGANKILYANVYSQLSDLPNAAAYHGMFAHVHGTGKAYYAHAGAWVELANAGESGSLSYTSDTGDTLLYADGTYDFGSNIIKYANAIDQEADLANYDPGAYHGMTMHVHSTGALYYAHAGAWRKLLTDTSHNDVEGAGYVDPLADVAYDGDYNSLSGTPTTLAGYGITDAPSNLTDLGISDGTNGQVLTTDGAGNFSFTTVASGTDVSSSNIGDLANVSAASASSGQVLKWDGSQWAPASDSVSGGGGGITLTDLSVTTNPAGSAALIYNNGTGTFTYTPPDLSSYLTTVAFGDLTGTPTTLAGYGITDAPSDLTDLGITDGSNGQVLTTDGAGNFSFTTVTSGGSGISNVVEDTTPQLGGTLDANGNTIDMGANTITDQKVGLWDTAYGWGDHSTQGYLTSETFTSVVQDTTPQLGGDLDVNGNSIQYTFNVTNNGASDYTFSDTGNHWFPSAENDPVLYLRRGETYVFDVNASGHPFQIRTSSGGSAYNTGVTNNGAQVGQITFKVPMSAPSTLYYICTIHSSMGNTINVV